MRLFGTLTKALCFAAPFDTASAQQLLEPTVPGKLIATCQMNESCIVGQTSENETGCRQTSAEIKVEIGDHDGLARITHPNGSMTLGTARHYDKHGVSQYLLVATSDGSGSTTVTIFPNSTVIVTGHLTLARNVAVSDFGNCEIED